MNLSFTLFCVAVACSNFIKIAPIFSVLSEYGDVLRL